MLMKEKQAAMVLHGITELNSLNQEIEKRIFNSLQQNIVIYRKEL